MPQVDEQVRLGGGVEIERILCDLAGQRPAVDGEERDRFREPEGLQPALQGGDQPARGAGAAGAGVHAFEPDDAAAERTQSERPL